ncbi:MAG: methylenetetrahydrofolate reductase [NAD(P)H] [Nitrospinae bacterium]|nr:methylenetetrahydrofolate reductase [NAD(P)H] [Nitrospinota bacterium]
MRIADLLSKGERFFSLEFFPPKERPAWPEFFAAAERLKSVNPLFVSVTYGAGGGTQSNTLELVARLKKDYGFEPMAHLTCVGASGEFINGFLDNLAKDGIDNVLALRGDPPRGDGAFKPNNKDFSYACDLVRFIRKGFPKLGVGVAAYPETHPEAVSPAEDLLHLKEKLELGSDFAITQLFFDNSYYWDFVKKARAIGIEKPIIPGVLPIVNLAGVKRIVSLCGAKLPPEILARVEEADATGGAKAVEEVGLEIARKQVRALLENGAPGVHLYTLNRAETCLKIIEGCA